MLDIHLAKRPSLSSSRIFVHDQGQSRLRRVEGRMLGRRRLWTNSHLSLPLHSMKTVRGSFPNKLHRVGNAALPVSPILLLCTTRHQTPSRRGMVQSERLTWRRGVFQRTFSAKNRLFNLPSSLRQVPLLLLSKQRRLPGVLWTVLGHSTPAPR
jgi:hypothetical protein